MKIALDFQEKRRTLSPPNIFSAELNLRRHISPVRYAYFLIISLKSIALATLLFIDGQKNYRTKVIRQLPSSYYAYGYWLNTYRFRGVITGEG